MGLLRLRLKYYGMFTKMKKEIFTDYGKQTITTYLKDLIVEYIKTQNYPYTQFRVLGLPYFNYSKQVNSSDELLGRIKSLGLILFIEEIDFETDKVKVHFSLDGNFVITEK